MYPLLYINEPIKSEDDKNNEEPDGTGGGDVGLDKGRDAGSGDALGRLSTSTVGGCRPQDRGDRRPTCDGTRAADQPRERRLDNLPYRQPDADIEIVAKRIMDYELH